MEVPTQTWPLPAVPAEKPRARILVTDDRPGMTVAIKAALAGHYECEFAKDVAQAREMLTGGAVYDLVICDTDDPGGSTMGLAEAIVKAPSTPP